MLWKKYWFQVFASVLVHLCLLNCAPEEKMETWGNWSASLPSQWQNIGQVLPTRGRLRQQQPFRTINMKRKEEEPWSVTSDVTLTAFHKRNVLPSSNIGGGSVTILTPLQDQDVIDGTWNSVLYQKILRENVSPSDRDLNFAAKIYDTRCCNKLLNSPVLYI